MGFGTPALVLPSFDDQAAVLTKVYTIPVAPAQANPLVKELARIAPLPALQHLKRVRKPLLTEGPDRLEVILTPAGCEDTADANVAVSSLEQPPNEQELLLELPAAVAAIVQHLDGPVIIRGPGACCRTQQQGAVGCLEQDLAHALAQA